MDVFRRQKFNEAMFAKNRTLAIRVGQYQSSDIKEASFEYGYIKGDTYKPGGTCAGSGKITFTSIITTFNKLDKIYPEIGLLVNGTYEWVKMGEYFINDIEIDRNRNTTTLELMDGMFKLNREHVTDLTYPAEIRNVIKEICLKTGVVLANETMGLASMNYRIDNIPKDKKMTFRDVLGLSAQMLGMSCFFNREGKLEIKELTDSGITITADSYFMHGLTKSEIEYQIAGITCKKDKETLTVGLRTGRSLEIENVLMYQSALDNLYHGIKDIRYYPFSLNYQGHLLLDVGQWVTIKTNTGETFKSPVLSQSFNFKGGLRGRISADSKAGNDAQYSYAGTITKKILQFDNFEARIQHQIEEADKDFDNKVKKIKKDFDDQIELVNDKVKKENQKLSDEINRRFQEFNPSGFEEAKAKAEEALQKAGANADLVEEAKRIAADNARDLNAFKTSTQKEREKLSDELKRYSREESENKLTEIREVLASNYVSKRTYVEDAEGTRQRLEAITKDNKSKLAEYKQTVDGQFTKLSSQIADKVDRLDFQQVKETSQLYERVLGNTEQGLPDKISRLVMTNEIFQTEVNDLVVSDNNLIVNSETLDKHTIVNRRNNVNIGVQNGIFTINAQGLTGYNWGGFTLPIYVPKILKGEVYTLGFKYKIRRQLDHEFCVVIKNHSRNKAVLQKTIANPETPVQNVWIDFQGTFKMTEDLEFEFDKDPLGRNPIYFYLVKNGLVDIKEPMLVRGPKTGSFKPSQFDEAYKASNEAKEIASDAQARAIQVAQGTEAVRTKVTQLAGSWAVQNLNSAGDIIAGINVGANGNNRIIGRATHITGETLIDKAVIKSAMIDKLKTANFEAGSVTTTILGAEAVTAEKVKFDTAFIQRLVSQQAFIDELFAKQATITKIRSIDFTANHIKGGVLTSINGGSVFDLNNGQIRMQGGPTGWRTSWDSNGLAFRGPGNDVWGAMGGDSSGGVGIYMRGNHAFNLVVNHTDKGVSNPYTALRVKYGDGTYLQFSPGGPSYNLLLLFNDIYRNIAQLHDVKTTSKNYSWSSYGPLK